MMETKVEYKITELGEIPIEWEVKKLKEISTNNGEYGIGARATEYDAKQPRYLRITDISEDGRLLQNNVRGFDDNNYELYILKANDIVFARTGNTTGKSYIYKENDGELVYAGFLIKFSIEPNTSNSQFIFYNTQTLRYKNWISKMSVRSGQPGINSKEYGELFMPVPSLGEQQKIAKILSTVDEQIDQTDQLIEKTNELKKGLMQELLTKGIGHKEFKQTELGNIPINWTIKSLVEISNNITIGLVTSMTKNYVETGVPLIRNSDIKEGFVRTEKLVNLSYDFATSNKHKMLKRGDIVTIHTGDIGTSAVIDDNLIGALGFATLQTTALDNISPEWLMLFFNSEIAKKQFYNFSTGDGRNNLNLKEFVKTRIIVPNLLEEQNKISSIISAVDEKSKGYQDEKSKYEELKKGLMQQLLTGKTRVKVD